MNDLKVLYLIQQAGSLLQMPRSHVRSLGNTFDTVASHSFHVAIIAYCIARMEGLSHDDGSRCLAMGLLHDLAEARTGDLDFVSKNYTKKDDKKAVSDQFAGLAFGNDLKNLILEYEDRTSLISKCAKDADMLQQTYLEWVLAWQGNKLAEKWFAAKKLMLQMKDSNPQKWWWSEFVEKGVNLKHLNGK